MAIARALVAIVGHLATGGTETLCVYKPGELLDDTLFRAKMSDKFTTVWLAHEIKDAEIEDHLKSKSCESPIFFLKLDKVLPPGWKAPPNSPAMPEPGSEEAAELSSEDMAEAADQYEKWLDSQKVEAYVVTKIYGARAMTVGEILGQAGLANQTPMMVHKALKSRQAEA